MLSKKVAKVAQTTTDRRPLQWDSTRLQPYIESIAAPSDQNELDMMVLLRLNRNFRDGARAILHNEAWAKWRADTKECLEIKVPKMIAESDMEIVTVLVGYTDRPNIQAEILSMIWQSVGTNQVSYWTLMAASLERHKLKFTDLICTVLTMAETNSPRQIQSYMNTGLMLEHILKRNISCTIPDDLTTADVDENRPTVLHTFFTVLDTSFCILEKIYKVQYARAQDGKRSVKMEADVTMADLVQIENDVQTMCTKLLCTALCKLDRFVLSTAANYTLVMRKLLQRHMPQMLGFSKLTRYTKNYIKTNEETLEEILYVYGDVFMNDKNPTGTHEYLDSFLQEAEEIILEHFFVERHSHRETRNYTENIHYHDPNLAIIFNMYKFRGDLDIAQAQMARRLVPVLTRYFDFFPIYMKSHESILQFLCSLNMAGSTTPSEIQHSILTSLCETVYSTGVIAVLMRFKHTRKLGSSYKFHGDKTDQLLQTLITNSLEMNTEQNSMDLSRLMQTRIFDIFVMKLHTWLDNPHRTPEELTLNFRFIVRLLELRRNPPARGFIFARVMWTPGDSHLISHEKLHMDVPDNEYTTGISDELKNRILHAMIPTNSTVVEFRVERVTIWTILKQIEELPEITDKQRELWSIIDRNTL